MAVAVEGHPSVVLDDEYRIVEANEAARATLGPLVGRNVLDAFPGSRPLFLPYYEHARRSGECVEFSQYYGGYVLRLRAIPDGPLLVVEWTVLAMLDVLTLDGLRASLAGAVAQLEKSERELRRERMRSSLRLVAGGAGR